MRVTAHLHLAALDWISHIFPYQVPRGRCHCGSAHDAFLVRMKEKKQKQMFLKGLFYPTHAYSIAKVSHMAKVKVNEVRVTQSSCNKRDWRAGATIQSLARADTCVLLTLFQVLFQAFWLGLLLYTQGRIQTGRQVG